MPDKDLKSAFEIAMERLRQKDAEQGIEQRSLTDEQKAAIAEVKNFYEAKLAELEVMHRSALRRTVEPAEQAALEESYRRERDRLTRERDVKIERLRSEAKTE